MATRDIPAATAPPLPDDASPARMAVLVSGVMERAAEMGLLDAEAHQVGARLPMKLLEQARRRTGIGSTTDLLAFALANVAVEDDFAKVFAEARGTLDADLEIGF